jgi:hypothetical protein
VASDHRQEDGDTCAEGIADVNFLTALAADAAEIGTCPCRNVKTKPSMGPVDPLPLN